MNGACDWLRRGTVPRNVAEAKEQLRDHITPNQRPGILSTTP